MENMGNDGYSIIALVLAVIITIVVLKLPKKR